MRLESAYFLAGERKKYLFWIFSCPGCVSHNFDFKTTGRLVTYETFDSVKGPKKKTKLDKIQPPQSFQSFYKNSHPPERTEGAR